MTALHDYFSAADTEVGEMIEGHYGWSEHCPEHATAVLNINPGKQHRSISIFEVCNTWRDYRCAVCSRLLWDRNRQPDPIPPTPRPAAGKTVVAFPNRKQEA